jgi:3-dehydroquinate synthase
MIPESQCMRSDPESRSAEAPADASPVIHQRISIPFEYPVHFEEGIFRPDNPALAAVIARCEPDRRHRLFVVVDQGLSSARPELLDEIESYITAHPAHLDLAGPIEIVPGGEAVKNDPSHVAHLHRRLHRLGIDRQSFVLVAGGGAVQDMAGFAAATAHRGIRVLRIPTTVLSQNDSGVGVKNGINAHGAKNFLGTFAPPFAVINDFDLLRTLSPRDRTAGIAEAVKVALIRDPAFFDWLEQHTPELTAFAPPATRSMIFRCAELHLHHIATAGDPFEFGTSRPLDFGHWAAHRLETLTANELRHGEAVAIGMALDTRYSVEIALLPEPALDRICTLLEALGLPLWSPALGKRDPTDTRQILRGLTDFREHLGGDLAVTLLESIGQGVEVHEIDDAAMERSILWLEERGGLGN